MGAFESPTFSMFVESTQHWFKNILRIFDDVAISYLKYEQMCYRLLVITLEVVFNGYD